MICPALESIYDYLDGALPPKERAAFEAHLSGCPGCRAALEERRAIAEAAASLPMVEAPEEDFVSAVMSRLSPPRAEAAPARRARRIRLAPVLTGASALGAVGVAASLLTGNGLFGVFLGAGRIFWDTVLSAGQGILKAAKVVYHIGQLAGAFLSRLVEGFRIAVSFVGPEVQIAVLAAVLVGTLVTAAVFGRKSIMEKRHGQI